MLVKAWQLTNEWYTETEQKNGINIPLLAITSQWIFMPFFRSVSVKTIIGLKSLNAMGLNKNNYILIASMYSFLLVSMVGNFTLDQGKISKYSILVKNSTLH